MSNYYYIASEWEWSSNPFVITAESQPLVTVSSFNRAAGPTDNQIFSLEYNFKFPTHGVQFQNKATGLYLSLYYDPTVLSAEPTLRLLDAALKLKNGSIEGNTSNIVFTWGAVNSGGWSALRPSVYDYLNLNVKGGGTYTNGQQVILYPWKGGYQNMQWKLFPA